MLHNNGKYEHVGEMLQVFIYISFYVSYYS